jgi:hypothetical protein
MLSRTLKRLLRPQPYRLSADQLLIAAAAAVAAWALLAQLYILLSLSFQSLCNTYLLWLVLQTAWCVNALRRVPCEAFRFLREGPFWALSALSIAGSLIALGWVKPNADDVMYIGGRAVYFVANPDQPVDLLYHHLAGPFPVGQKLLFVQTVDLLWGFVAQLLGSRVVDVYHVLLPAIGGFLIPLVWYSVLRRLVKTRQSAVFGAFLIVSYLCLDGLSQEGFGNFAFVRIWQGKAVLLSIYLPLFTAWSLDFFRAMNRRTYAKLWLLGVVATGLSASSMPIVSLFSVTLAAGQFLKEKASPRAAWKALVYGSSLGWLITVSGFVLLTVKRDELKHLGFGAGFPDHFRGQFELVFTSTTSFTFLLALASFAVGALLVDPGPRRFLLGWVGSGLVLFLNPIVMPLITEHLTSYNIYWRLFYTMPFPLVLGLSGALAVERWFLGRAKLLIAGASAVVALVIGLTWAYPVFSVFGELPFAFARTKVTRSAEEEVDQILLHTPPGAMLAPLRHRVLIPLYDASRTFPVIRNFAIFQSAANAQNEALAWTRIRAGRFVQGDAPNALKAFEVVIADGIRSVILDTEVMQDPRAQLLLSKHGFEERFRAVEHVVFVREAPPDSD